MKVTVVASLELDGIWATEQELRDLSDEEIIDLIHEDLGAFLDGATWGVTRLEKEPPDSD